MDSIVAAEKLREATEKVKDLDAQKATVAGLNAIITAQKRKISQLDSAYKSGLQNELAEVSSRIQQLKLNLERTIYKEGLMELKAPQDGTIKDLATTTVGAVVQPSTIVLTLVPGGEELFADVLIKNDDVGFTQVGQSAQIKLAAYPFQKYGMSTGKIVRISANASEENRGGKKFWSSSCGRDAGIAAYKARVKLDQQGLKKLER